MTPTRINGIFIFFDIFFVVTTISTTDDRNNNRTRILVISFVLKPSLQPHPNQSTNKRLLIFIYFPNGIGRNKWNWK